MSPLPLFLLGLTLFYFGLMIFRAKRHDALGGVLFLMSTVIALAAAFLLIWLGQAALLPSVVVVLGGLLMIIVGSTFLIRGIMKKQVFDEQLMKLNPLPDIFFKMFGKKYFYLRSIGIGVIFVILGILVIIRKGF